MTQSPIQNRWAFLVGINAFVDPQFKRLNFCVNDVKALQGMLEQLDYTVVALHDEQTSDRLHPTRENVEAELLQLCQRMSPQDLLFVHFACHGKLIGGEPILVLRDSRAALLSQPEKRLSVQQVRQMMRNSGASRLFLSLDACHTGVDMGRGDDDPEFIRNVYELAEGFVVMAGSTAQQQALEMQSVQHGVYTYYLLQALAGQADRTKKSFVSVEDVASYVTDQLKRWGAKTGLVQEPTIEKAGMGDMILADWRDRTPPVVTDAAPQPSGAARRRDSQPGLSLSQQRQADKRKALQDEWNLRMEKLSYLRQADAIETGAEVKFQLGKQIQAEESALQDLERQLSLLE